MYGASPLSQHGPHLTMNESYLHVCMCVCLYTFIVELSEAIPGQRWDPARTAGNCVVTFVKTIMPYGVGGVDGYLLS